MVANKIAVVEIRVKERDGLFHAFSPDMPELHLCSDDRRKLSLDVPGMIKALYRLNYGLDVQVINEASPTLKPIKKASSTKQRVRYLAMPEPLAA